jgi:hypothetical protein
MATTIETVTRKQIRSLMSDAQLAGDYEQVGLCETVLAAERTYTGSDPYDDCTRIVERTALILCVAAIRSAEA